MEIVDEPSGSLISETTKQNYRIWKKNAPHLYDYLQTSALLWPSLTVEWFPDVEHNKDDNSYTYRMLTGSFTSGSAAESLKIWSFTAKKLEKLALVDKYNVDSEEFLSTDRDRSVFKKLNTVQDILHHGEVNRARYMPQKPDVIASINNNGNVYIFDRTKHSSSIRSTSENSFKPQIKLPFHKEEGFGLSWNKQKEGLLLSAALSGDVALWDIKQYDSNSLFLTPSESFSDTHTSGVNDTQWLPKHDSIFSTVGENGALKVFDTRSKKSVQHNEHAHDIGINAISFNQENLFCFATGDSQGLINLWDLRHVDKPVYSAQEAHNGSITVLEWNANESKVLASGGQDDNLVKIWDFSQVSNATTNLASNPNPEELLFVHGGHMLGVNDLSWNPNDPWMITSTANDNSLHVWRPSQTITNVI